MSDVGDTGGSALDKEREMREHERQAREHDSSERGPDAAAGESGEEHPLDPDSRVTDPAGPDPVADAGLDDPRAGRPGPAGNAHLGGGLTGGS